MPVGSVAGVLFRDTLSILGVSRQHHGINGFNAALWVKYVKNYLCAVPANTHARRMRWLTARQLFFDLSGFLTLLSQRR